MGDNTIKTLRQTFEDCTALMKEFLLDKYLGFVGMKRKDLRCRLCRTSFRVLAALLDDATLPVSVKGERAAASSC